MMTCSSLWEIVLGSWDGVNPSLPSYVHVRTEFAFIAYLLPVLEFKEGSRLGGVEHLVQEAKMMVWAGIGRLVGVARCLECR
jgi:hypothetical protein